MFTFVSLGIQSFDPFQDAHTIPIASVLEALAIVEMIDAEDTQDTHYASSDDIQVISFRSVA